MGFPSGVSRGGCRASTAAARTASPGAVRSSVRGQAAVRSSGSRVLRGRRDTGGRSCGACGVLSSGGWPVGAPAVSHHRVQWTVLYLQREIGPDQRGDAEVDGGGHAVVAVDEPGAAAIGADHDGEAHAVSADLLQQPRVVLGGPLVVEDVANVLARLVAVV